MGTRMRRSDARKPTKPKAVLLIPMCAKGGGRWLGDVILGVWTRGGTSIKMPSGARLACCHGPSSFGLAC